MNPTDRARLLLVGSVLALTALALVLASIAIGYIPLSPTDLLRGLFSSEETPQAIIAREIRLPRALLGLIVGISMGLSGAALQGLLRNPLAEPGLIGVSASAGLGAVTALYLGIGPAITVPAAGMAGAFVAVLLIVILAGRELNTLSVILAGIAVNAAAISGTSLVMNLSPNPWVVTEMLHWLLGSLADHGMKDVWLGLPFMMLGWILLLSGGRALDALSLGEETAISLGVNLAALRVRLILGTALAVGASVALVGSIAFVGLIVPHLLRPLVFHRPGALLWVSGLGGAVLVLAADIAVRLIGTNPELHLGVLTGVIGGPFFLFLILRLRNQMA
jgi:iron complex transport system permease protein